jgi:hypothetical protein
VKDGKIGLFVNALDGYQGSVVREVQEAAVRSNLEVQVFDGEHSPVKLGQSVIRFQHENPGQRLCVFVLPEDDASHKGAIEDDPTFHVACRLGEKGVGWITLNHGREDFVGSLRKRHPHLPIALVAIDNVAFGRLQGQQLRRLLPEGGTALCVRGLTQDSACRDRSLGLKEALQGSLIEVTELDARWDEGVARGLVRKWITSPLRTHTRLDAIVSQNDQMGRAVRQELAEIADKTGRPELKAIPVLGGDGLPEIGRPWVDDGTLTGTVCVTLPGRPAVEQLASFWRNGAPLAPVTKLDVSCYPPLDRLNRQGWKGTA